jgi:tight adherence protein C
VRAAIVVGALGAWLGVTLVLADVRWFARTTLTERLRPYAVGSSPAARRPGVLSVESFRDAIGPLSRAIGERAARLAGVSEDLEVRLARVHATVDVTGFRVRQIGWSVAGLGVAALVAVGLRLPPAIALVFLLGGPVVAFLVQEQRLAAESHRWQRRIFLELPVVAEQLSLLLSAGWSLASALNRLAQRSHGATGRDLERVCRRIRQGLSETDALREWARLAAVPALDRLVPVLALNRDTSDLGRLVAEEARAIRRDVHRELIEAAERRNQQVWIPVTVAALVPGALFLAVPFVDALKAFGA